MDRLAYVAMSGAAQLLAQQAVNAHNLANVATTGFKADTSVFRVAPVVGPGLPTRAYAVDTTPGADLTPGAIQRTGRELDVAIEGDGFLTVQTPDGNEAYTRNGSLQVAADGTLQTASGLTVLGAGGPISIPPDSHVAIGRDGTLSATTNGQSAANVASIGQLKLVKADAGVVKGGDGLFRPRGGGTLEADESVRVVAGALEGSNVNAVAAMVEMINLSRQFDLSMKVMQSADQDAQRATQLLSVNPA